MDSKDGEERWHGMAMPGVSGNIYQWFNSKMGCPRRCFASFDPDDKGSNFSIKDPSRNRASQYCADLWSTC